MLITVVILLPAARCSGVQAPHAAIAAGLSLVESLYCASPRDFVSALVDDTLNVASTATCGIELTFSQYM